MPVIDRTIRISAPPSTVWNVLVDVPGQPRWMTDLKSVTMEPGPLRVGSRGVGVVRMFGITQEDPIEVVALDAPHRYGIRHLGRFVGDGTFTLVARDGGGATAVQWREELRLDPGRLPLIGRVARGPASGWSARAATLLTQVVDPFLYPVLALVFRADLRRLKRLVEGGAR